MPPLAEALTGTLPLLASLVLFALAAFVWKTGSEGVRKRLFEGLLTRSLRRSSGPAPTRDSPSANVRAFCS